MTEQERPGEPVPSWLWWSGVGLLLIVLAAGLGSVAALALGWRSPTPLRAPDWTGADLAWRQQGDGLATAATDGYRIRLSNPDQRAWAVAGQRAADFDLELDTHAASSNGDVGYGVLYRYQDADNYYLFVIGNDGYYAIAIVREGKLTPFRTWQQWPHVHRGHAINRLRVRCEAMLCRFYINGEFTAEIVDDAFLDGHLGLWAQNFSNDSLEVVFDRIRLWSLE